MRDGRRVMAHAVQDGVPQHFDVVVIAVTYNSSADIEDFLATVPRVLQGHPVRVIVADNDSADGTVDLLRAHDRPVEVLELGANRGYAAGINAGVEAAGAADAFLFANPDVRLADGALEELIGALAPEVGIVVPQLRDDAGRLQLSLRRAPSIGRALAEAVLGGTIAARFGLGEVVADAGTYARACDVAWASGAVLLVTAECLHRTGPWDDTFFLYSEETDFMLRACAAGLRTRYTPRAGATHRGGAAHDDPRLWALLTTNRVRLFARRSTRARSWLFLGAVLLNELLRAPRRRPHREAVRALWRQRALLVGEAPR